MNPSLSMFGTMNLPPKSTQLALSVASLSRLMSRGLGLLMDNAVKIWLTVLLPRPLWNCKTVLDTWLYFLIVSPESALQVQLATASASV